MVSRVKIALRISTDSLNEEINDTIDACYKDMQRVGVDVYDAEGNAMESAPHPKQVLWVDLGTETSVYDIIRRSEMEG